VWHGVEERELADQLARVDERHERESLDALALERRPVSLEGSFEPHLGHEDRLRIGVARRPGGMTVQSGAILIRQSEPGSEAHRSGSVEKQDRGPLDIEAVDERPQGRVEDVVEGGRPRDGLRHAVNGLEPAQLVRAAAGVPRRALLAFPNRHGCCDPLGDWADVSSRSPAVQGHGDRAAPIRR
jgi:hypothetical protein